MRTPVLTAKVAGDTLVVSWTVPARRAAVVPTRLKLRRRRLKRLMRTAAFSAARGNVGKRLCQEVCTSITNQVIQACQATAARYKHLRT